MEGKKKIKARHIFYRKGTVVKRGCLHGVISLGTLDKLEGIYPKQKLGFDGH